MPPWLPHIISYQKNEANIFSRNWVQLATVSFDNTPRVRTVVFRGWTDSCEMKILTDKRSQKFSELQSNNKVEICWLFPNSKCQFRFGGSAIVDEGIDTSYHWDRLDDTTKSMWGWPSPGTELQIDKKQNNFIYNDSIALDNFILLKINIIHVDQLILTKPIHLRKRWIKKKLWIEESINP